MKRFNKDFRFVILGIFAILQLSAFADGNRPISFEQLPITAQQMIKTHFAGKNVVLCTVENDVIGRDYQVMLDGGIKLEFSKKGEWKDVECYGSSVPDAIVPEAIKQYVRQNYPATTIVKIERDRKSYDIKLNNRVEIEFNKKMQVIDIDL